MMAHISNEERTGKQALNTYTEETETKDSVSGKVNPDLKSGNDPESGLPLHPKDMMRNEDLQRLLPGPGDVERSSSSSSRSTSSLSTNRRHDLSGTLQYSTCQKAASATFYGIASFMIMVVNKDLLTEQKFPSAWFLSACQMGCVLLLLGVGRSLGWVSFPGLSRELVPKIFPLPFFYLGNLVCSLSGTKALSLPMMTVLRRFSILMTMYGEQWFLNISQRFTVKFSVWVMIAGTIVAAMGDLAFNLQGYTYVFVNNLSTAGNNIYTKKKLDSKEIGKWGLLFYQAFFMFVPLCVIVYALGEFDKAWEFDGWSDSIVIAEFILSCLFAFILNFSVMLCTQYNSPLTTTIVGCLKNIIITYIGMWINSDYVYSMSNFFGVTVSVFGSLLYTKVTFMDKQKKGTKSTQSAQRHIESGK